MKHSGNEQVNTLGDAARIFQDHEGVGLKKVEDWSEQFGKKNQTLALKILKNVQYYSGPSIRKMVEELVERICSNLGYPKKQILFVPIGRIDGGASIVARALRGCSGISAKQIIYQTDLAKIPAKPKNRAIVLLDIFSGTGKQISDWWLNMETLLLPWIEKTIKLVLGILTVNYKAQQVLKAIPAEVVYILSLKRKHDMLSDKSKYFLESEKKIIKQFCKKTRCSNEYLYGRGQCGLLIAFKNGCPNNSLPILWYKSTEWKNIFLRRAL